MTQNSTSLEDGEASCSGTRTNSDYVNNMYVFDFSTNVWEEQVSTGAPTIAELEPMTANLHDGKIYYSGGQSSGMYRRIWSYEISTGNWARSAPARPRTLARSVR